MRPAGQWVAAVWALPIAGVAAVTWAAVAPLGGSMAPSIAAHRSSTSTVVAYPAESLARTIVARDVFRAGRRPASQPYDPALGVQPVVDAPPKPVLTLVGIVAGTEPTALIEGFPGIEGTRVVRTGDLVAGLHVRSIVSSAVRITGMDTVWTLTVREPWR